MKAIVGVRLKYDVPDGPGRLVTERLVELGYSEVRDARIGKLIELNLEGVDRENALGRVRQMCERLLVNQTIEEFTIISIE